MHNAVQVITAATALVAVIVGPAVSVWIARRQIRASVVSVNRHAWINNLRDSVADFLAEVNMASSIKHAGVHDESGLERTQRIMQLNHKIELLINPKESDHVELAELIGEATNALTGQLGTSEDTAQKWDERNHSITDVSQRILKREWDRVKAGD